MLCKQEVAGSIPAGSTAKSPGNHIVLAGGLQLRTVCVKIGHQNWASNRLSNAQPPNSGRVASARSRYHHEPFPATKATQLGARTTTQRAVSAAVRDKVSPAGQVRSDRAAPARGYVGRSPARGPVPWNHAG